MTQLYLHLPDVDGQTPDGKLTCRPIALNPAYVDKPWSEILAAYGFPITYPGHRWMVLDDMGLVAEGRFPGGPRPDSVSRNQATLRALQLRKNFRLVP